MGLEHMAWVRTLPTGRGDHVLSPIDKAILKELVSHAGSEHKVWPKLATLAQETGWHRSRISAAIHKAIVLGYLTMLKAQRNGRSNEYLVNIGHQFVPNLPEPLTNSAKYDAFTEHACWAQMSTGVVSDDTSSVTRGVVSDDTSPVDNPLEVSSVTIPLFPQVSSVTTPGVATSRDVVSLRPATNIKEGSLQENACASDADGSSPAPYVDSVTGEVCRSRFVPPADRARSLAQIDRIRREAAERAAARTGEALDGAGAP